jgi:hypothetical protein
MLTRKFDEHGEEGWLGWIIIRNQMLLWVNEEVSCGDSNEGKRGGFWHDQLG